MLDQIVRGFFHVLPIGLKRTIVRSLIIRGVKSKATDFNGFYKGKPLRVVWNPTQSVPIGKVDPNVIRSLIESTPEPLRYGGVAYMFKDISRVIAQS